MQLDATGLASGSYAVRLEGAGFVGTQIVRHLK
jgi:hypothetical protein